MADFNVARYTQAFLTYLKEAEDYYQAMMARFKIDRALSICEVCGYDYTMLDGTQRQNLQTGLRAAHQLTGLHTPIDQACEMAVANFDVHELLEECLAREVADAGKALFGDWDGVCWELARKRLIGNGDDSGNEETMAARWLSYRDQLTSYTKIEQISPLELEANFRILDSL